MGGSAICRAAFFLFLESFFVLWWRGVFAGVFSKSGCFGVVFLWCGCGDLRGWCGDLAVMFLASKNVTCF
ncbi:hypothetical protein RBB78_10345 [Tunturiibacter empetritectus]|uniref:hypothetical protein n=1 Tax=Tunturiibacter empetritectus TaxID=3069691 RepID=UPI003D9B1DF9